MMHYKHRRQRGFSLVELLVALAISGILMAGVIQVFSGSKQTDRLAMAMARVQENGRFAIDILNEELQHVGYMGCLNPNAFVVANDDKNPTIYPAASRVIQASNYPLFRPNTTFNPPDVTNNIVRGLNDFAAGTADIDFNNGSVSVNANPLEGTDALFSMRASSGGVILQNNAGFSGPLTIQDNQFGFQTGQIALITNCTGANVFAITGISTAAPWTMEHNIGATNITDTFSTQYEAGSEIRRLVFNTYYVRNNPLGIPSLYRNNVYVGETEMIQGVESLQVLYGHYDPNGTASLTDDRIRWVDADTIDTTASLEWREVVSVRLALLMRDEDNVLPQSGPNSFDLLGTNVTPLANDRRIRKVFTTTAKIRNRRGEVNF